MLGPGRSTLMVVGLGIVMTGTTSDNLVICMLGTIIMVLATIEVK